ncbi:hypothetical protein Dimus_019443 [Dionaea muscipula]
MVANGWIRLWVSISSLLFMLSLASGNGGGVGHRGRSSLGIGIGSDGDSKGMARGTGGVGDGGSGVGASGQQSGAGQARSGAFEPGKHSCVSMTASDQRYDMKLTYDPRVCVDGDTFVDFVHDELVDAE